MRCIYNETISRSLKYICALNEHERTSNHHQQATYANYARYKFMLLRIMKHYGKIQGHNKATEMKLNHSISIILCKVNYKQCKVCFVISRSYKMWPLVIFQDIGIDNHSRLIQLL